MLNSNKTASILFIAGTDTGVGKTFVTALLAMVYERLGFRVEVQKWVTTGSSGGSDDVAFVMNALGRKMPLPGSLQTPYCFSYPASPHLAAHIDGKTIDMDILIDATQRLSKECDVLLIEGAGGLMVPYSLEMLQIDLIKQLKLPVCLVARAGLGTLNHTFLSIEACRRRDISINMVVMNSMACDDPIIVNDNRKAIEILFRLQVIGVLPYIRANLADEAQEILEIFLSKKTLLTIL